MISDDEDVEACAEEYYNCGYDSIFEPKEKAVIFKCVGRGLKLPPLSSIYVHPFLLKGENDEHVRPSHHVLDLLSPTQISTEEPDSDQDQIIEPQSSDKDQHDDSHSESSDLEVYISDEDVTRDELDCAPAAANFQVRNSSDEKRCLPVNSVCMVECSSSGNHVVVSELPNNLNENYDSTTSDDEILSNPSCSQDSESDNEEVSVATNNLNVSVSGSKLNQDNSNGGVQNIPFSEDSNCKTDNSVQNIVKPSFPPTKTSATECKTDSKSPNAPSERCFDVKPSLLPTSASECKTDPTLLSATSEIYFKENASEIDGGLESSSSNSYQDPIDEMFSSDESEKDFIVNHFRSFKKDVTVDFSSTREFPVLSGKPHQSTQNPLRQTPHQSTQNFLKQAPHQSTQNPLRQAPHMPGNPVKIKDIAKLLLSDNSAESASKRHNSADANKDYLKQTSCRELFIENLPRNIDKENLTNFLQTFGELKSLILKSHADTVTAKVQIDADLEWVVGCLDGTSDVFGAESQVIRCYCT